MDYVTYCEFIYAWLLCLSTKIYQTFASLFLIVLCQEKEAFDYNISTPVTIQESLGCHVDSCLVPGGNHARDVILPPLDRTWPDESSSFFKLLANGCEVSENCP